MRKALISLLAVVTVATGALAGGGPALASRDQVAFFEVPRELLTSSLREGVMRQLASLGVHALRVTLFWHDVAPAQNSRRHPAFDATDPAAYRWGAYDALLAEAKQRGWTVLLTVSGPVPRWATSRARDTLTRPNPRYFEQFMTAVGRHYGSAATYFSIWNEPNHPGFLLPQYEHGQPASPRIYRALFQSGYKGLQAAGLSKPSVLMGETAPTGTSRDVAPLAFLRGALCLDARYHKASSCSALPVAGYAHHPYTKPSGPYYVPPDRDNVTIGALSRLTRALDRAGNAGAVARHLPVYVTEFGIQSKPNPYLGVSLAKQAEYDAMSERLVWSNPRVRSFSQYLLRDSPTIDRPGSAVRGLGPVAFQTGLELAGGRKKPSYDGFRLPLAVARRGSRYSLWGLVRPAGGSTSVTVLVRRSRSRRFRVLRTVNTNALGYWQLSSRSPGVSWRVMWRSPDGHQYAGPAIRAY